jgi:hypothetical protein
MGVWFRSAHLWLMHIKGFSIYPGEYLRFSVPESARPAAPYCQICTWTK